MEWVDVAQDKDNWGAVVDMVMNLEVLFTAWSLLTSLRTFSFSRRILLHGVG
jgi:hypothetical protein